MLFLSRSFYFLLLHAAARLPLFDSSPPNASPLLRWDVLHFIHIADVGYVYEHQWAFFPAIVVVLRLNTLLYHAFMSVLAWDTYRTFQSLSLYHLRSSNLASLASALSLIPTSPVTLYFAPYNEPFSTYLSYRGMLFCTRREWFKASICFALAGCFRSNGIFLSGFILWGLVVQPFLAAQMPKWQNLVKATAYTAVVFAPFIAHHIFSYLIFCSGTTEVPVWCSRMPPSLYTYVQSKYWNNGFLAYWTLNQLPNFLISAPTIFLITAFSIHHISGKLYTETSRPFRNPTITPHAIHALVLTSILVFSSNVQIILRLAASMPIIYWAAAWLLLEHPKLGRLWVVWSILWSVISTILWATFLPPA